MSKAFTARVSSNDILIQGKSENSPTAQDRTIEFWSTLSQSLPSWVELIDGTIDPEDMRANYVCSHAVFLRAIGSVGKRMYQLSDRERKQCFEVLSERKQWYRSNHVWNGKIFDDNKRVINNKSAEASLYKYLITKLQITEEA